MIHHPSLKFVQLITSKHQMDKRDEQKSRLIYSMKLLGHVIVCSSIINFAFSGKLLSDCAL